MVQSPNQTKTTPGRHMDANTTPPPFQRRDQSHSNYCPNNTLCYDRTQCSDPIQLHPITCVSPYHIPKLWLIFGVIIIYVHHHELTDLNHIACRLIYENQMTKLSSQRQGLRRMTKAEPLQLPEEPIVERYSSIKPKRYLLRKLNLDLKSSLRRNGRFWPRSVKLLVRPK